MPDEFVSGEQARDTAAMLELIELGTIQKIGSRFTSAALRGSKGVLSYIRS